MTKGELFKILKDFPDDVPLMFNVEESKDNNWDTQDVRIMADAELCPGYEGCVHTEPEMQYEVVFFINK
jgi:hypothetical protein